MILRVLALLAASAASAGAQVPDRLAALEKAVSLDPGSLERLSELAMFHHAHEGFGEAIKLYQEVAERQPDNALWPYLAAVALEEAGDLGAALASYQQAYDLSGGDPAAVGLRLARARAVAGEAAEAKRLLEALLDQPGVNTAAAGDLGILLLGAGETDAALRYLEQALDAQPEANRLNHAMAAARRQAGDLVGARAALANVGSGAARFDDPWVDRMRRWSQSYSFYMSQGLLAARAGDLDAAHALLQRAREANPDAADVTVNLARVMENQGQLPAAAALLDNLIETQPEHAAGWFNRGVLYELERNDSAALEHYEKALEHDPRMFQGELLAAAAAMRLTRYGQAAQHYEAASALRPERDELLVQLAVAQWMRDCEAAIETSLGLVRRRPEDGAALTLYIRVVSTCPSADPMARRNALNAARNLQHLSDQPEVVLNRAMAEAANGDFDLALALHQRAVAQMQDVSPESINSLSHLTRRYAAAQIADRPFVLNEQILIPRRLTAADRR